MGASRHSVKAANALEGLFRQACMRHFSACLVPDLSAPSGMRCAVPTISYRVHKPLPAEDPSHRLPRRTWLQAVPAATAACLGTAPAWAQGLAQAQGPGLWTVLASALALLALPLLAWACYRLGRLQAEREAEGPLQNLRQELRLRDRLEQAYLWRSDAANQLQQVQAPGGTLLEHSEALPQALATLLSPILRARQPFDETALLQPPPPGASRRWRVTGEPAFDASGRFQGYVGQARPVQAEERAQLLQRSLGSLMLAQQDFALVWDEGEGPVLQWLGPALQAAWPGAVAGTPLADCLGGLPPAMATAVRAALAEEPGTLAPARTELGGWWLQRFEAGPETPALWLGRLPAVGPASAAGAEAEQFSMTLSHDLRAPIRVVEGFTRIVKEDYGRLLDRVGNDHLDRVLGAAARMNLMIDALLNLARLSTQPLARQPVNLSQLAQYIVEDLRRSAPERQADVEIQPGLVAQGDPTLLRLVLENLLGNAWKYSARCQRTNIALRCVNQGGLRVFEVQDNGAGFDMRSADRLFGLFQRLHSANDFAGHGVGLASVKRIVQRHGGDIWAESEPGRGASFHFTLPN